MGSPDGRKNRSRHVTPMTAAAAAAASAFVPAAASASEEPARDEGTVEEVGDADVGAISEEQATPPALPPTPPPPTGYGDEYRVEAGDSLWAIARTLIGPSATAAEIAGEVARLWKLNLRAIGAADPNELPVGTVLRLR